MNGQLSLAPNGNITPCPWADECINYPIGCRGESYWCKRFNSKEGRNAMIRGFKRWQKTNYSN